MEKKTRTQTKEAEENENEARETENLSEKKKTSKKSRQSCNNKLRIRSGKSLRNDSKRNQNLFLKSARNLRKGDEYKPFQVETKMVKLRRMRNGKSKDWWSTSMNHQVPMI